MAFLGLLDISLQSRWPLLLVPLAIGIAVYGYRNTTPDLSPGQRAPLIALRSLAFLLLFLVLASPILNREKNEPQKPVIAVLVDESASMSSTDGQKSRTAEANRALSTLQETLAGEDVDVEVVPFATGVQPPQRLRSYLEQERAAEGPGTDILGAIRETSDRLSAQNLQSILLLSDGRSTRGSLDASEVSGLGRPVYVIGLGDTLRQKDLGIDRCEYGPVAYMESETTVRVRIENSGFRGKASILRLFDGEEEIFRKELRFAEDFGRDNVEIPVQLKEPGRKSFRLVLDELQDEATTRNNSREIRIEVLKNRLRLLLVAARPDWDVGFLKRVLEADPNVELRVVHQRAGGSWISAEDAAPFSFPQTQKDFDAYDLYVLGSLNGVPTESFFAGVTQAVERGRGLWVLAGRDNAYVNEDAYKHLAPALPVQRDRRAAPQFRVEGLKMTPQARLHPATSALGRLSDVQGNLEVLPPALGQHFSVTSKPGSVNLLTTSTSKPRPVLTVGRYGNGHTAAYTAFPFWRWLFSDEASVTEATREFVGHMVRWLTQPRDVKRVQIATSKPVYEGGETVDFLSQVLDPQFEPLEDAEVRLEVRRTSDKRETTATLLLERRADHPGEYTGSLSGLAPGEYEVEAIAERLDAAVGRDTTFFTVETYSIEFANSSQDVDFLRELAQRTGGTYGDVSQAGAMGASLPRAVRPIILRSEIEVWNTLPLFALFILCLAAEWLLRKKYGLL